jgi:hypothetical protein
MDVIHEQCFDAIISAAARRNCSLKCAEDLVPADLKLRSWAEWARRPVPVNGQPNGMGTCRRAVDIHSWRREIERYAATKQKAAA